jgi:hypothetical protein
MLLITLLIKLEIASTLGVKTSIYGEAIVNKDKCVLCGDPADSESYKLLCETCAECLDPSILIRKAEKERQEGALEKR